MDIFDSSFEQKVLTLSEVFVYKVPPLRSASGHRAEDWELENPLFTGCIRCYQADKKFRIVVYSFKNPSCRSTEDDNTTLFAECPIEVKPKEVITGFVDGVIDSSRYYVLRVKDPRSSRSTMIGIGFRERESAFDFKSVLNDYVRYVDRMELAEMRSAGKSRPKDDHSDDEDSEGSTSQSQTPTTAMRDLSIKSGEKIKIAMKSVSHSKASSSSGASVSGHVGPTSGGLKIPAQVVSKLLAPPPPPSSSVAIQPVEVVAQAAIPVVVMMSSDSDANTSRAELISSVFSSLPIATDEQEEEAAAESINNGFAADEDWGDFEAAT